MTDPDLRRTSCRVARCPEPGAKLTRPTWVQTVLGSWWSPMQDPTTLARGRHGWPTALRARPKRAHRIRLDRAAKAFELHRTEGRRLDQELDP